MITYDESKLNVERRGKLKLVDGLEHFATQVSLAKPMIKYVVDNGCVGGKYVSVDGENVHKEFICSLDVYEQGELLGSISCNTRYRGGSKELVYQVESFRIDKSRGSRNATASKDMKVALRTAKKTLIAREQTELMNLIHGQILEGVQNMHNKAWSELRWSLNPQDESFLYAMTAYRARLNGETHVKLPSKLKSVGDVKQHDERCARAEDTQFMLDCFTMGKGYGIQTLENGNLNVYDVANRTITRYESFYELPIEIQNKYGMFKVLKDQEIVTTIGVKFNDTYSYIVE